jgi:hypothetical protein
MENEERILAEALAQYANAEPLAGLEQRVLQRVRSEGRRRVGRWPWALAASVAVAGMFAVLWVRTAPQTLGVSAVAPRPPQIVARAAVPKSARRQTLPKRRVFPTPVPLSGQERALLAFAAHAPDLARDLRSRIDEPIQFTEIKIAPLESADLK